MLLAATSALAAPSRRAGEAADRFGPNGIYANVPERDEYGRDQLAMFRLWNPDPVANHAAQLRALHPALAAVVRRAQADHPDVTFVIGSGRRSARIQRLAVSWGWSHTRASRHRSGRAVDLWPLDSGGRVTFDAQAQSKVASAMMSAAATLKIPLRWGERFRGYRDQDRSHFELAR